MEESFLRSKQFSASQEISHILLNSKVHYRFHKSPPLVPILSHINPVYAPIHFLKIQFNIILLSTPGYSKWLFPSGFPTKIQYAPLLSPLHSTCHKQLILVYLITWIIFGEQYRSLSSSLWSLLYSPATSSLLGPNILLSTFFSNTQIQSPSLNVSDQISHAHKTTGQITFLYV